MLTIIYPYRNRDLQRLKNSLESLKNQSGSGFEVFLVDYGSNPKGANEVHKLCREYAFVTYEYKHTRLQPWNKSKALNSIIKNLSTTWCFIADVDMIFHPRFIEKARHVSAPQKIIYFQVGFLGAKETTVPKEFSDYKYYRKSSSEATGMSLFPVKVLQELRGFDEFYHFWGAEDTDMHVRLKNAGYEVEFYDKEVLMLHQWHETYRSKERKTFTRELQLSNIVQLNYEHLKFAMSNKITFVNQEGWGNCMTEKDFKELEEHPVEQVLGNEQRKIDHFIYIELPGLQQKILKIKIKEDPAQHSLKTKVKKVLGKKLPSYYSLKEINDNLLLHLISFHRNSSYTYKINKAGTYIELAIKKD